jgi:hypothetical protein
MQQLQHRPFESPQTQFLLTRQLYLPWKQRVTPNLRQDLQPYIPYVPESRQQSSVQKKPKAIQLQL